MDHETAIRLQAAEQYVSGGLPEAEREEFEEHYFGCAECAEEVHWEHVFAANMRAALRELPSSPAVAAAPSRRAASWFSLEWLRPAFAASALANVLLLGVVGYHAFRLVPSLESALNSAETPQLTAAVTVPTPVRSEPKLISVPASVRLVPLSFAVPRAFPKYHYEVTPETGGTHLSGTLPAPDGGSEELLLSLPTAKLEAGTYRVVLEGLDASSPVEIGSCRLKVEH